MGCIGSSEAGAQGDKNKAIERQLRQDAEKAMKEVKLLLLGAGECGKSTILKQMKIIHGKGYPEEERKEYIPIIYANIVQSMVTILRAMETLDIVFENPDLASESKTVHTLHRAAEDGEFPDELAKALLALWKDGGVQKCFERSKEYQLNDSAGYYLDSLDRLAEPNYIPNEQDVLRSRVKTTGIVETHFHFKDLDFKVFDVGKCRNNAKQTSVDCWRACCWVQKETV